MSRNQWRFRPSDLRRLFKAMAALGKSPIGVEVTADGAIKVLLATEPEVSSTDAGVQA